MGATAGSPVATANAQVFVTLAALCKRAKVALMWGELFGGGGGGLMARSRPGLDADPLSIRGHLLGVMAQMSPAPEGPANRYGVEVDGHVYVASDADVSALAASMTQFTLDALCADGESAYPVAAYLIGFRKFWEFKQPFDTIPIDCTGAFRPETTGEALTPEDTAQLGELVRALQASTNAAGNRPA